MRNVASWVEGRDDSRMIRRLNWGAARIPTDREDERVKTSKYLDKKSASDFFWVPPSSFNDMADILGLHFYTNHLTTLRTARSRSYWGQYPGFCGPSPLVDETYHATSASVRSPFFKLEEIHFMTFYPDPTHKKFRSYPRGLSTKRKSIASCLLASSIDIFHPQKTSRHLS